MLNVIMMSFIMLSVIMLSVIMLSALAPVFLLSENFTLSSIFASKVGAYPS